MHEDDEQSVESSTRGQEIVVFMIPRDTACEQCGTMLFKPAFLRLLKEGDTSRALCLACGGLGHLEFLPSGKPAVTRRAGKYSSLRAVVLKWSRARKRYERQGILAEVQAIERAENECLSPRELRERQRLRELRRGMEEQDAKTDDTQHQ
jgi:hypothetical protein